VVFLTVGEPFLTNPPKWVGLPRPLAIGIWSYVEAWERLKPWGRRDHSGWERERFGLLPFDLLPCRCHLKSIEYMSLLFCSNLTVAQKRSWLKNIQGVSKRALQLWRLKCIQRTNTVFWTVIM
jgi:hypothetical protein